MIRDTLEHPARRGANYLRRLVEQLVGGTAGLIRTLTAHPTSAVGFAIVFFYGVMAIIGPHLPVPGPFEVVEISGEVAILESPSRQHPMGTTPSSYSVLAQTIHSFRTSVLVGSLSAIVVIGIGVPFGLVSGYFGGWVDTLIMSATDFAYGLPLYPLGIVVVALLGSGLFEFLLIVAMLLWRNIARVTRSETLKLREKPYIKAAKASGTNDIKIMMFHILPQMRGLIVLYALFGTIWGILLEAGLSFLGFGDPNVISWGEMLQHAFNSGAFSSAWWWVVYPSLALWILLVAIFLVIRGLEEGDEVAV